MFGFVKQIFISAMMFFDCDLSSLNPLKCISKNNQECEVRPQIVNVNSEETVFFPFSIKTTKCSADVFKNLNVKMLNLMSRTNETRHIEWYETCKYKCRQDESVCINK